MKLTRLFVLFTVIFASLCTKLQAQSGDQILDGIGETGLIARYVFDGNVQDWSRNNLHAQLKGDGGSFVADKQFKKVLSLNDKGQAYLSIPADVLAATESLSITGWLYLRSDQANQVFFDFGKDNDTHFYVAPSGDGSQQNFKAEISASANQKYQAVSEVIKPKQWNHIAIVIDIPSKSFRTYLNGSLSEEVKGLNLELDKTFDNTDKEQQLFIGKSLTAEGTFLNANLFDFRIYRIPLNETQIARIFRNALNEGNENRVNERKEANDHFQSFDGNHPQLYNEFLTAVEDVKVETSIGHLPRLPRFVEATYQGGISGPKVRVIWPAPKDNSAVLEEGQYTLTGKISGSDLTSTAIVTVKKGKEQKTPELSLAAFDLDQVSLDTDQQGRKSKFIENRDKFILTLAKTNPDDFLYMFRNAFGQSQPEGATPLGVWDSQETKLRGHATGHYLTAIAQAFASTAYDPALQADFAKKMEYMVNTLFDLSQMSGRPTAAENEFVADPRAVPFGPGKSAFDSDLSEAGIRTDYWNWGEGFISAYPPDQFIMLEQGATYGGQKNQVWAPYYTLHKILAGLMDIYEVSGNEKALQIAEGMGTWVHARLSQLPTETLISMWNSYIAGEFGGMNEAMARLYRLTNEVDYIAVAELFDNISVFYGDADHSHGLAKNVDTFRGLHANQHIPQIMGALEMYRGTDSPAYYHIADNFWHMTTGDYMYSIGGVAGARNPANAECFISEPATLYENGFSAGGQNETCATYNMLKLSRNLFLYDQSPAFMDYYERGLYNHILASVAENSPANTYHVPLRPGSSKHFGNPHMKGFTCCNGTAIESSTKLQNSIYFKSADNQRLYVNLFIPSTLNWTDRNIKLVQSTAFPHQDETRLTIQGSGKFDLKVRVPQWATKGFFVKINGKKESLEAQPGSYITLSRKWKNGDTVEIKMPFQFHLEPVMDQQNIASLFYGPILLAAQESEARKEWRKVTLDARDIGQSIEGDPEKLEFIIDGVTYKPFYDTYGRHSVYLDVLLK
ncbi:hypothetical protein GCM10028791_25580 [Echinicola sediminis]